MAQAPDKDLIFSASYDLLIELTPKDSDVTRTLRAYSASLAATSKVWRKALDTSNGFRPLNEKIDSQSGKSLRVLHMDDVSLESAIIFFDVLHFRVTSVPREVSLNVLRDVASLADMYDCSNVLLLWAEIWVAGLLNTLETSPKRRGFEDWVFISDVFGNIRECKDAIQPILVGLIRNVTLAPDFLAGSIKVPGYDGEIHMVKLSQKLLDHIVAERDRIVTKIIEKAGPVIQGILKRSNTVARRELHSETCQNELCLDVAIGSLRRCLEDLNLKFLKKKDQPLPHHISIESLVAGIENIRLTTIISDHYGRGIVDHSDPEPYQPGGYCGTDRIYINILQSQHEGLGFDDGCPLRTEILTMQAESKNISNEIMAFP